MLEVEGRISTLPDSTTLLTSTTARSEFNLAGAETDPDAPTFAGQKGRGHCHFAVLHRISALQLPVPSQLCERQGAAIAVFGGISSTSSPDVNISNCSITENTVLVNPKVSGMTPGRHRIGRKHWAAHYVQLDHLEQFRSSDDLADLEGWYFQ
ncbi:MAG: hypothetical protein R3F17_04295 [Planctomycetota bacterium]